MRISDWSSDVCSSDLPGGRRCWSIRHRRARMTGRGVHGPERRRSDLRPGSMPDLRAGDAEAACVARIGQTTRLPEMRKRSSADRRVGQECVDQCIYGWSPYISKKNKCLLLTDY